MTEILKPIGETIGTVPLNYPEEAFQPFPWDTDYSLIPGVVVRVSSELSQTVHIFECTGLEGGRRAEGFLTILKGTELVLERKPAIINTRHPSIHPDMKSTPHIDFVYDKVAGKKANFTRYTPPFSSVDTQFSEDLNRMTRLDELHRQLRKPLSESPAKRVIESLVDYLAFMAENSAGEAEHGVYLDARDLLARDLLT